MIEQSKVPLFEIDPEHKLSVLLHLLVKIYAQNASILDLQERISMHHTKRTHQETTAIVDDVLKKNREEILSEIQLHFGLKTDKN